MKKVSVITVLLMLASVPSVMWADEILLDNVNVEPKGTTPPPIITAPKWDEFCEPGYENAVSTDKNDVFNYIIFVKLSWMIRIEGFVIQIFADWRMIKTRFTVARKTKFYTKTMR